MSVSWRRPFFVVTLLLWSVTQQKVTAVKAASTQDLYGQAVAKKIAHDFPLQRIEYLLLDAQTRETVAMRWPQAEVPIPPGSLLKPFIALAYAESRNSSRSQIKAPDSPSFPSFDCHGKRDGCWRAEGHGLVGLEQALAVSCNAYFLRLARDVINRHDEAMSRVAAYYSLPQPPKDRDAKSWIGVTSEWRMTPMAIAHAYASLFTDYRYTSGSNEDAVERRLREGMRLAALPGGTASAVGAHLGGVLAKTGTAPCVPLPSTTAPQQSDANQQCRINGDGLVVLAAPAEHPRWILLVRQRGTTGAMTAKVAGELLSSIEEMDGNRR